MANQLRRAAVANPKNKNGIFMNCCHQKYKENQKDNMDWKDLAPDICRRRMILEGTLHNAFEPSDMAEYCLDISKVLDMTPVSEPVTDYAEKYGHCCFMHWKESGMHIYGWDNRNPKFFFYRHLYLQRV